MSIAQQLIERMQEVARKSTALATKYEGFMKLYNAACMENNQQDMEQYRQLTLACVEQILDNSAVQFMLARQYDALPPSLKGGLAG
jgi:hypothetical protein